MLTSIIIPTYNRAVGLSICLEAIAAQTMSPAMFEVIVVDNNSRDNTKDVVLNFIQSYPTLHVHYLFESQQGSSFARNSGVQAASGEYLIFTDDDARPFPNWLNSLMEAFTTDDVGCAGGPISLDFLGQEVPSFLRGDLQAQLSRFELPYDIPTVVSTWTEFPYGVNMAIRKSVFDDIGLFRTDLGPSATKRLTAEETELIDRAFRKGWKIVYVPDARIDHLVPKERLTKSHIYRVSWGLAASHVILTSSPRTIKIIRWFASDLWYSFRMFLRLVMAIMSRKPLLFDDYIRFWRVAKRVPLRIMWLIKGDNAFITE